MEEPPPAENLFHASCFGFGAPDLRGLPYGSDCTSFAGGINASSPDENADSWAFYEVTPGETAKLTFGVAVHGDQDASDVFMYVEMLSGSNPYPRTVFSLAG